MVSIHAQTVNGSIVGSLHDLTGLAVAAVDVRLRHTDLDWELGREVEIRLIPKNRLLACAAPANSIRHDECPAFPEGWLNDYSQCSYDAGGAIRSTTRSLRRSTKRRRGRCAPVSERPIIAPRFRSNTSLRSRARRCGRRKARALRRSHRSSHSRAALPIRALDAR